MRNGLSAEDVRIATAAATAFLTPSPQLRTAPPKPSDGSEPSWIDGPLGKVPVVQMGEGRATLLVHGWEGQVGDFSSLIRTFLPAGYRLIAFDLPGHGASEGTTASIPDCAETVLRIQKTFGPLHAVIGHSVGAAISVHAAGKGLHTKHMVLISAPSRYEDYARRFAIRLGLSSQQTEEMIRVLDDTVDVHAVSIPETARRLSHRALFIHSMDDRVVPVSEGLANANAWPGARLLRVEGLGHRRILHSAVVLAAALRFISD